MQKYDVLIIGSGIGSLACASFISQLYNKKVAVIEQYSELGGYSRQITAKSNVPFEIGIHQVGELNSASLFSKLMKFITGGEGKWRKLPSNFIKFQFPDFLYEVTEGQSQQIERLATLFPLEEANIKQYYKDIEVITKWYRNFTAETIAKDKDKLAGLLASEIGDLAMLTTEKYLEIRFSDKKLRSLIGSHWTDYGLPPKYSAFLKHALLVNNHKEGVYYPEYGSKQLIDAIVGTIIDAGGDCLTNTSVKEVKCIGSKAEYITVIDKNTGSERKITASIIISGIGMYNTYNKLLNGELVNAKIKAVNDISDYTVSFVSLLVTLKANPETIGADQSLVWCYSDYDHNKNFENRNILLESLPSQFSISFPSLKKTQEGAYHSMKINTLVDYVAFQANSNGTAAQISERNKNLAARLLGAAEKIYPGLNDIVESWELQTPFDAKKFTQHVNGNIFGLPDTPERFKNLEINCYTPFDNVFLTGSDITSSGIYATILGGALTASAAFNDKDFFMKIMLAVAKQYPVSKAV